MKKLITLLSVLTLTSSTVPLTVACNNKEKESDDKNKVTTDEANHNNGSNKNGSHNHKGLDISNLNSKMFQKLDILPIGIGPITTKSINDMTNDFELTYAIRSHIKVMILKNVFGLDTLSPKTLDGIQALSLYTILVGKIPSVLDIQIDTIKVMQEYRVTVKKEKWENLKINSFFSKDLKPYYNLITGTKAVFTITRGQKEIVNEKEFNINNLNAGMFKQLNIIDWNTFSIHPKNINEINNNQEIVDAIDSTIWVMIWNKIFGYKEFDPKIKGIEISLFKFIGMYKGVMSPIIKLNLEQIKPNHEYILTIEKDKWQNIKLSDELLKKMNVNVSLKDIKPYYDLIKGETTAFNIIK